MGEATPNPPSTAADPQRRPPPRLRLRARAGVLALVLAATAAGAGPAVAGHRVPGGRIGVDAAGCGSPPARGPAGPVSFRVTDRAPNFVAVYLTDPSGRKVYAEIPWIAPAGTQPLSTTLAAGRYTLRCVFSDGAVRVSHPMALSGRTTGAVAGYRPLPDLAMTAPVTAYRAWLKAALPRLAEGARALDADVARGDLAAARRDWLPAHLDYERLGAAYNSFGDFDAALDGTADGLPGAVHDPDWTGFHAIEYGLWHGRTAGALRPLTRRLVDDVRKLTADFPSEEIDPGDLPLRAHEILENALQFQLTGAADYGSGTTLATLGANVEGTAEVVSVLAPLIAPRDPALLRAIRGGLAQVTADLRPPRPDAARRARLDGDLGALLEQLSSVPDLLAPRTSA
ncbi:high-affinity iron transporter [Actinacidiphila yanglinensis]|uniref:High-affinity iron transporter n=1 Tax=Actinacidiphila yanglinensis TaxID=310779 RepID=A0A1H6D7Z9_9ACTN|nr:EfeM/EfeO family lipoprotein [Actinacidiphila yanglinensis]SEG81214.1 high-affinity iron transporter [Actinacidiphila yanglinensis]